MGESRGGGGGGQGPTTSDVVLLLTETLHGDQREPAEIHVTRVTEGLFAVQVRIHGEREPEAYFLSTRDGTVDSA